MSSNTANVENGQRSQRQQRWIEEWELRLDRLHQQEQNTRNQDQDAQHQHESNEDPQSEIQDLQSIISDLEGSRAEQAAEIKFLLQTVEKANDDKDRLRGLHLGDLDVDELEQLNNTIQEASKLVQQALKRRKAEEAVAEGQNTFRCPIGLGFMNDPVVAADGHTYERKQIEAWFASPQFSDLPVKSPKTNVPLKHTMLIPNHALKSVSLDAVDKTIASMRPRERAASPPAEVDESVGTVRTC